MNSHEQPLVSVDVVPMRFRSGEGISVAVGKRLFEPFIGELALPGVLLLPGESLAEAARRALSSKTNLPTGLLVDAGAFDATNRDPRGASISIAFISVQQVSTDSPESQWLALQQLLSDEQKLPFDHNGIVRAAHERLTERLWNDAQFTRSLLGERFTTADVVALKSPTPHVSNASRWLSSWGPLQRVESQQETRGVGRPSTTWSWK